MSLPTITRAASGAPSVDFAGAVKPDDLVVEVLEAGAGALNLGEPLPIVLNGEHAHSHSEPYSSTLGG